MSTATIRQSFHRTPRSCSLVAIATTSAPSASSVTTKHQIESNQFHTSLTTHTSIRPSIAERQNALVYTTSTTHSQLRIPPSLENTIEIPLSLCLVTQGYIYPFGICHSSPITPLLLRSKVKCGSCGAVVARVIPVTRTSTRSSVQIGSASSF
jgi:hypothetical protein